MLARDDELLDPRKGPNQQALLGKFSAPPSIAPQDQGPLEVQGQPVAPKPKFQFNQGNVLGLLRGYDPTPEGLTRAYAEHPELTEAGSRIENLKSGKILDPTTGRVVDVGASFGSGGGVGWWWGDDAGGGQQRAQAPPMASPFGGLPLNALLGGDATGNINQALASFSDRSPNLAALLAQLQR